MVAGDADESHAAVGARLLDGLDRAAPAEDLVELLGLAQVVKLPEVEVVGPELAQAGVEQAQRAVAIAGMRLRCQKDAVARARACGAKRLAIVVLALRVRRGRVAVAHAQPKRLDDHRHGLVAPARRAQDAFTTERNRFDERAGSSELAQRAGWALGR